MSQIRLVGCVAEGNVLLSMDDPGVWLDEGEVYGAHLVPNPVDFGRVSPQGRLRRIAQSITSSSAVSLTITPIADQDQHDDQAETFAFDPAEGTSQVIESEVGVDGQRFQYRIDVAGFSGPVEIGSADIVMIPKRSGMP